MRRTRAGRRRGAGRAVGSGRWVGGSPAAQEVFACSVPVLRAVCAGRDRAGHANAYPARCCCAVAVAPLLVGSGPTYTVDSASLGGIRAARPAG
ncbi:hypothetical protein F4561_000419 [Lipingzhangella halophila]|uniref:Uncharacterized protein n=1 Tax=Lipingzhangella halophila TaxID=1783352 RepID=A0A7W7RCT6_9ACTN|nr:hypothetical protein [Lipingzhangella halophila]